jgi:CheY-like chemotaxis protein
VMDGYELAAQMRRVATKPLRLIALTGYGQDQDRERTTRAGFDAHAVKPVEIDELNELISSP